MSADVLLLNASYEPLDVIPVRRAMSLLMRDRVVPECLEAVELHSVAETWRIPTVIRLRYYVNVPRRGISWSRDAILRRDRYTCGYCGVKISEKRHGIVLDKQHFTVDHILPVSRGGKNTWGNTVCACAPCNQRKANHLPNEVNMHLLWEPKTPRTRYIVASGEIPAEWKTYLKL